MGHRASRLLASSFGTKRPARLLSAARARIGEPLHLLERSGLVLERAEGRGELAADDFQLVKKTAAELLKSAKEDNIDGVIAGAKVRFDKQWTRFDNLAEGEYEDTPE